MAHCRAAGSPTNARLTDPLSRQPRQLEPRTEMRASRGSEGTSPERCWPAAYACHHVEDRREAAIRSVADTPRRNCFHSVSHRLHASSLAIFRPQSLQRRYRRLHERCRRRRGGGGAGRDRVRGSGSPESGSSSTASAPPEGFGFRGSRTPAPPPPRFRRHRFQNRGGGLCSVSTPRSDSPPVPSSVIWPSLRRAGHDD